MEIGLGIGIIFGNKGETGSVPAPMVDKLDNLDGTTLLNLDDTELENI